MAVPVQTPQEVLVCPKSGSPATSLSCPVLAPAASNLPALSIMEVTERLQQTQTGYAVLLLRPAKRDPQASPSEQPFLVNDGQAGLCCTVFSPQGVRIDGDTDESVIVRGETIHGHMIQYDPRIADRVLGPQGLLQQALDADGITGIHRREVRYIDPYSGLPGELPTAHNKILYLGPGKGYEVLAVLTVDKQSVPVDFERQKSFLLQNTGPHSRMEQKEAALAYLLPDEQAQYELMCRIEPFYLTTSRAPVKARNGQFDPRFVQEYLGKEAQKRAYNLGMIAWPERFVVDDSGKKYYTKAFVDALKEFHSKAKLPALKLILEREYPFLPQETPWYALGQYNAAVEIPRGAKWAADKAGERTAHIRLAASGAASQLKQGADAAVQQAKRALVETGAEALRETAQEGARKLAGEFLRLVTPRIY